MEMNSVIFFIKNLYFVKILDFIWTWILNLLNFFGQWLDLDGEKFGTGSGSQNMTFRSSLVCIRGESGPGVPESTPAGFWVFLSDPDPFPESIICEKPEPDSESFFNFGSSKSLCGHFFSKNMGKLRLDR